ncbi:hypothetical protein Patl1_32987 [Pistacia atlantica]|uniref:Uncharacterized protein n=1 Tax=Pistacia atlantica TaxID=434234 RepID=A0ACC1AM75_9ROSI|nr:hypothetical protein Patl1_32987 [Pistacia atlantica]
MSLPLRFFIGLTKRDLTLLCAWEFAQAKALIAEKAQEATTWMEQHGRVLDALRIPEPTQVQCHDIDKEVSQLIAELDQGLSSASVALQAYAFALQRILPLNYLTTGAVHGWAQVLQLSASALSADILTLARRQAAELIVKIHGDNIVSIKCNHEQLCLGSGKYMKSANLLRKEFANSSHQSGQLKYDGRKDAMLQGAQEENKERVLSVLNIAVSNLYEEVKRRVLEIFSDTVGVMRGSDRLRSDFGTIFCEFEEQVEKCILVAEFVNELWQIIGKDMSNDDADVDCSKYHPEKNWASIFKTSLLSCKNLVGQMTEVVLPDVMRSAISFNSEVMDAFGSISQMRGSIDTALEQLVEVELERASLVELEQNYFVKVGLITEQKLALEEAAVKGRDHLSWEEAEELASQEEACRAELNQLHQTWKHRDMGNSSLMKQEADIRNVLVSSERHLQSVIGAEEFREPHVLRSKALLTTLVKPSSELESVDKTLTSFRFVDSKSDGIPKLAELMSSGRSISEYREIENLKKLAEETKEITAEEVKKETEAVRRVQLMLEEYCNGHETARAARSAASLMKRQVNELREALLKTSLEIVQMEWMHDDLERAMGWACGGPNSTGNSSTKTSGIPHEFHDHLMRRRQLLWEAREKASDIFKICMSILDFELSRDGIFQIPGEAYPLRGGGDGRTWQQAYLNALTKLEVAHHSFTCTEQEWKLAESSMEAASNGLYSATSELCIASLKAKSASASVALSAFGRVSRSHTALTSESGSMLEEIAIFFAIPASGQVLL